MNRESSMRLAVGLAICIIGGPLPALAGDEPTLTPDEKRLLAAGYQLHVKNGEKIFCRREIDLATRFPTKICGTAEQIAALRRTSRESLENTQRPGGNP